LVNFLVALGRSLFFVRLAGANQPVFNRVLGRAMWRIAHPREHQISGETMMFEAIL
jgi:hypothetical protein